MAIPAWFNEVEYLNNKLAQLKAADAKDPSGNAYTNVIQVKGVIASAGMDPFAHYNSYGSVENLNPSSAFNAEEYCLLKLRQLQSTGTDGEKSAWAGKTWQDVQYAIHNSGMSVGAHYTQYGAVEGVAMSNSFDTTAYLTAKLAALVADPATKAAWATKGVTDVAKAILAAGMDPYTHYLTYGGKANEVEAGKSFAVADPVHPSGGDGKTFQFTIGLDSFNGSAANDTFIVGPGQGTLDTLTAGDSADGGAGRDTLKLYDDPTTGFNGVTLKNIEVVESYVDQSDLDLSKVADVQEFWAKDSEATKLTANLNQQIGFEGTIGGASTITYKGAEGAEDKATLSLKGAGFASADKIAINVATGDEVVETLNLSLSGKNTLDTLDNGKMKHLVITGEGSLKGVAATASTVISTANNSVEAATLESIDASKATGDLNLNVATGSLAGDKFTYTGGTGKDKLVMGSLAANKVAVDLGTGDNSFEFTTGLKTGSTVKAGAGTNDTLILNATNTAIDKAAGTMFSGFENLVLKGAVSYEKGWIADIVNYEISQGAGNVVLDKMGNGDTVTLSSNGAGTVAINASSSTLLRPGSTLNLVFDNKAESDASGSVANTFTTDYEVLDVKSNGMVTSANANTLTMAANGTVKNVTITGTEDFSFTTNTSTVLTIIDGAKAEGKLNINATAHTGTSLTITSGAADDTISGGTTANTITGGKGGDKIDLTAATTTDTIKLSAGDSQISAMDVINAFDSNGEDKIDLTAVDITSGRHSTGTLSAMTAASLSATADNAGLVLEVKNGTNFFGQHGVLFQEVKDSSANSLGAIVYIDSNSNGSWDATDDVVVLVGASVYTNLDAADIKFTA